MSKFGEKTSGLAVLLLAEQRKGWRLMIFYARATRSGSSVWLAGLSGLSSSSERISSPINQTNQIDEIDQMNKHPLDARSGRSSSPPSGEKMDMTFPRLLHHGQRS
jgi:hypothetical protein